jgi:histidine triad (HIT) family protein
MPSCIFCSIAKGVAPASIVFSDKMVVAFLDTQPVNPGHTLIIPRAHVARLSDPDEETGGHLFKVAMKVASALRKSAVRCEGINLLLADGEAASQDIFHVHLHVIPRAKGDGFGMKFGPRYGLKPGRGELNETASKIREAMG